MKNSWPTKYRKSYRAKTPPDVILQASLCHFHITISCVHAYLLVKLLFLLFHNFTWFWREISCLRRRVQRHPLTRRGVSSRLRRPGASRRRYFRDISGQSIHRGTVVSCFPTDTPRYKLPCVVLRRGKPILNTLKTYRDDNRICIPLGIEKITVGMLFPQKG